MSEIYLQQALAQAGLASRRAAGDLIKNGHVKVNGQIGELGQKVNLNTDKIQVKNKLIKTERKIYYLVNKPLGYTCTTKDKHAAKKIINLVPPHPKVWPVGRLDKDSSGLIILTNDGDLTNQLTHPKFKHEKEYIVKVNRQIDNDLLSKLAKGVKLTEGLAKTDKVKKLGDDQLSITLHQGWNRQIRRMLGELNYKVEKLERIRIAKFKLGNLESGQYKIIKIPS